MNLKDTITITIDCALTTVAAEITTRFRVIIIFA